MALNQVVTHYADSFTVGTNARAITLLPTFQRGYVPNVIDGFRFTLRVTLAIRMPTKI
jgi:hypothetical protein